MEPKPTCPCQFGSAHPEPALWDSSTPGGELQPLCPQQGKPHGHGASMHRTHPGVALGQQKEHKNPFK